jgi:hypothetical protein
MEFMVLQLLSDVVISQALAQKYTCLFRKAGIILLKKGKN